jgi:hypothetical protein
VYSGHPRGSLLFQAVAQLPARHNVEIHASSDSRLRCRPAFTLGLTGDTAIGVPLPRGRSLLSAGNVLLHRTAHTWWTAQNSDSAAGAPPCRCIANYSMRIEVWRLAWLTAPINNCTATLIPVVAWTLPCAKTRGAVHP